MTTRNLPFLTLARPTEKPSRPHPCRCPRAWSSRAGMTCRQSGEAEGALPRPLMLRAGGGFLPALQSETTAAAMSAGHYKVSVWVVRVPGCGNGGKLVEGP
jgi:hypothetical protein